MLCNSKRKIRSVKQHSETGFWNPSGVGHVAALRIYGVLSLACRTFLFFCSLILRTYFIHPVSVCALRNIEKLRSHAIDI